MQDSNTNANIGLSKSRGIYEVKSYELDSKNAQIPLNKTAGRFYFQKLIDNFAHDKDLYKEFFCGTQDRDKAKAVFAKFVSIVNLETNSHCNRKCHYCPLSLVNRGQNTQMKPEIFDRILENLAEINYSSSVSLNLYNEPLSDENLIAKLRRIRQVLPKAFLRFNSNGDFLTPKILKELESSGANYLNITLHTTKANSYSDSESVKKLDKFCVSLNLPKPQFQITPNVAINAQLKFGNLTLALNTSNYDIYGTDRGGGIDIFSLAS